MQQLNVPKGKSEFRVFTQYQAMYSGSKLKVDSDPQKTKYKITSEVKANNDGSAQFNVGKFQEEHKNRTHVWGKCWRQKRPGTKAQRYFEHLMKKLFGR